ncbi:MAG: LytR family transcriptional regulator [Rhodoglobus sp.]|nr:LytR family transcriptional regulator [Rhodoglobus sp.]
MSELRPRSELRSGSGELRRRSAGSTKLPGIARHGQLKKSHAFPIVLKFIAAALAVVVVSGASVGAIAVNSILSKAQPSVALIGDTPGPPPQIGAIDGGFNILIVGSDRCEVEADECGERGSAELNDVNMLLHVSQDQTNATAISFPRDLVVGIPECPDEEGDTKGYSTEPLNTALYYGGLPCVVLTIEELTGLDIQFAGEITFNGVINMSDAIGGVPVCVDGPIHDEYTGLAIDAAGTYNLMGRDALAFLRSRHGVGDGSDITRISSQQVYLSSLVRTLKSSNTLGDVTKLYNLANAALSSMTLSTSLADPTTMVAIALALKNIPIERVTFVQYPGTTGNTEGLYANKVKPNFALGDQLMELVKADQPFLLAEAGDGAGSMVDPNAPAPDPNATPDPDAPVIDNTGLPTIDIRGQTAADYTCSISNDY